MPLQETKTCVGPCKRPLPLNEFSNDKTRNDGLNNKCRTCDSDARAGRRSKTSIRNSNDHEFSAFLKERGQQEQFRQDSLAARSISLTAARQQWFLEQFKGMAKTVFKDKLSPSGYALKPWKKRKTKRILNLLLSDLHIGARLEANEHPYPFGPTEEARRLSHVIMNTVEYKTDHRDETELNVYLAGDVVEGLLMHETRSGAPLVEQSIAFMRYITQALLILSARFPTVRVYCQTGNHGRNKLIHPAPSGHHKHDSHEGILYNAIKLAMEVGRIPNVTVDIPPTPYCAVPLFDSWAMVLHGDVGPVNFGNPAKTLNVSQIAHRVAEMNATKAYTCGDPLCRDKHGGHEFSLVAGGHVHVGAHVSLPTADIIINPALVPSNWYALDLGYIGASGQRIWESVPGHPMGDSRLIKVGRTQDIDASLDKIIAPYEMGISEPPIYAPPRVYPKKK